MLASHPGQNRSTIVPSRGLRDETARPGQTTEGCCQGGRRCPCRHDARHNFQHYLCKDRRKPARSQLLPRAEGSGRNTQSYIPKIPQAGLDRREREGKRAWLDHVKKGPAGRRGGQPGAFNARHAASATRAQAQPELSVTGRPKRKRTAPRRSTSVRASPKASGGATGSVQEFRSGSLPVA